LDFSLLDLRTMEDRRLTQLDDAGFIQTLDVTPDGTRIVFDRLREDSDIVLIDLMDRERRLPTRRRLRRTTMPDNQRCYPSSNSKSSCMGAGHRHCPA